MMTMEELEQHAKILDGALEDKRHQIVRDVSLRPVARAALEAQINALQGRVAELRAQVAELELRRIPVAALLNPEGFLPALHPAPGVVPQP